MVNSIIMKLIFCFTFIIFINVNYVLSQSDPRNESHADFFHELFPTDNNQRFGRVRFSEVRQNDEEYRYLQTNGMLCTTVKFTPYSIFHEDAAFDFNVQARPEQSNEDHISALLTANHIGKQSNMNYTSAMTPFYIEHMNDGGQICVRDFAHVTDGPGASYMGFSKDYDISNTAIDWMQVTNGEFGLKTYVTALDRYGCKTIPIDTINVSESIFLTTLEHTFFWDIHYVPYVMHYDAIWMEDIQSDSVKVCWQDELAWDRSHAQVNLMLHVLPTANAAPSTTQPTPNKDYFTGKFDIDWPNDVNVRAVCTDIPFNTTFNYTPLIFASYSVAKESFPEDHVKDQPLKTGTVWVETANTYGMQMCFSGTSNTVFLPGDKMTVYYMLVTDMTNATQETAKQTGQAHIEMKYLDTTKLNYTAPPANTINPGSISAEFITEMDTFIKSFFPGIPASDFLIETVPHEKNSEVSIHSYFHIRNQLNIETSLRNMSDHFDSNTVKLPDGCGKGHKFCTDYEYTPPVGSEEEAFLSKYYSTAKLQIMPLEYGGSCIYGPTTAGTCKQILGGDGGKQEVTKTPIKQAFGQGESCEVYSGFQSPCNVGPKFTEFKTHLIPYEQNTTNLPLLYVNDFLPPTPSPEPIPPPPNPIQDPVSNSTGTEMNSNGGMGALSVVLIVFLVVIVCSVVEFFMIKHFYITRKMKQSSLTPLPTSIIR